MTRHFICESCKEGTDDIVEPIEELCHGVETVEEFC